MTWEEYEHFDKTLILIFRHKCTYLLSYLFIIYFYFGLNVSIALNMSMTDYLLRERKQMMSKIREA